MSNIICGCCAAPFKGFSHDQATGCATESIAPEGVQGFYGHYGSAVADGTFFACTHLYPTDKRPPLGAIVCDNCLIILRRDEKIVEAPYLMQAFVEPDEDEQFVVTCACCASVFDGFAKDQAMDCDSEFMIFQGEQGFYGAFGSAISDGSFFACTPAYPLAERPAIGSNTCDPCLQRFIDAGHIIRRN